MLKEIHRDPKVSFSSTVLRFFVFIVIMKPDFLSSQYLRDVNCPFKIQDRQEAIDWLLGLAVRLEYGDNGMFCGECVLTERERNDVKGEWKMEETSQFVFLCPAFYPCSC